MGGDSVTVWAPSGREVSAVFHPSIVLGEMISEKYTKYTMTSPAVRRKPGLLGWRIMDGGSTVVYPKNQDKDFFGTRAIWILMMLLVVRHAHAITGDRDKNKCHHNNGWVLHRGMHT